MGAITLLKMRATFATREAGEMVDKAQKNDAVPTRRAIEVVNNNIQEARHACPSRSVIEHCPKTWPEGSTDVAGFLDECEKQEQAHDQGNKPYQA